VLLAVVVAFGAGVVSFLAPCTVPLLPAYVGVLSGSADGTGRNGRLVSGALLYVVGFTAVFVTLGLLAGSVGSAVRRAGGPVQRIGGVVVLVLALLVLLDRGGGPLARLAGGDRGRSRLATSGSRWSPMLLGVVFASVFTPCVGPFLGGVLTLAAREGGAITGGVLLGVYSLGIGAPFVAAALALSSSPALTARLARVGRPVSVAGAVLLAALGVAMLTGEYARVAGWFARVLPFPSV